MASTSSNNNPAAATMNYALVSGVVVDVGTVEEPTRDSQNTQALLTNTFEHYAARHPNPALLQEQQECNALLQQVAAQQEEHGVNTNSVVQSHSTKRRGLFGFLFGNKKKQRRQDEGYDVSHLDPDEYLEYYHDDEDEQQQDNVLCNDSLLDTICIPKEAYATARFHLCRRPTVPNVARTTTGSDGTATISLVDLGVVCELGENGRVMETSDRVALQDYVGTDDTITYDVRRARALLLGNDLLLAVSWGLPDGIIVMYHRHEHLWVSIAVITPTRAVTDNIQQQQHSNVDSSMLVTDLVAMQVQDPNNATGVVTTLCISRLGGYIELIILPLDALLQQEQKQQHHHHLPHFHKRKRQQQHYAADLVNISTSNTAMTALTTADYHVDVMCLELWRTTVTSDTEWDTDAFPKTPPAEYVLVASGGTSSNQTQVVSFWGVSIVFPENVQVEAPSIHVAFLDGINLGRMGADVTVFSSETMWNCWRKPRRVRLRKKSEPQHDVMTMDSEGEVTHEASDEHVDANLERKRMPPSTLSTAMPIVQMRLTSRESQQAVVLAALDGNGGVTFIDCTMVIALASHDVTEDELGDESLIQMRCRLPSKSLSPTVDIGWLDADMPNKVDGEVFYDDGCSPSVSLVVFKPRMLQVMSLPLSPLAENVSSNNARVTYSLDLPSMSHGAAIVGSRAGQGISFIAFKATEKRRKLLCQGNLERLDSSTVIVMLVKAAKYAEAIAAAKTMNVPDSSDAIQLCHRQLWEREGSVEHLSAVTNDDYVVKQALAIFDNDDSPTGIDLATARAACLLALERASGVERAEEVTLRLEALEAKVSTYILLCMGNEAIPQLEQFRAKFLQVSLAQLASAFASNGDISALTMILFRHRPELLPCQLEVLDKLPLETPPDSFAHLFPVPRHGKNSFHTGEHGIDGLRQWPLMAHYMESTYGVRLLLDDKDETAVLDRCQHFDDEGGALQETGVWKWYLARSKRVQNEIGSVSLLRNFLELASQRLGVDLSTSPSEQMDPKVCELCSTYTYTMQLNRILTATPSASTVGKLAANALASMSLSDIGKMSVDDRVSLILGPPNDPSAVLSKFRNGSMFLTLGEQAGSEESEGMIDDSVSAYCVGAISHAVIENGESGGIKPQQADALRTALDVCTEIANASRSTIRRPNRVVKESTTLENLVVNAAYETSRVCKLVDLGPADCCHLVDSIWECFECLPVRLTSDNAFRSEAQTKVDGLFKNLVVVDIFSRWSPAALGFLVDLNMAENGDEGRERRVAVGLGLLSEMCQSFCHQVGRAKGLVASQAELDLLRDFLSDIDQLDKVGFNGTLPMALTLQENLVKPLLRQEKFHLIDPLAHCINRDEVQASVLAFVNEAMFSDGDDALSTAGGRMSGDRVQAAINCQDVLGPLFPALSSEFVSSRRYLDAASFINRMMAGSNEIVSPSEVRDRPPLDTIESLLRRNPGCILDGCSDWSDPAFSRRANETICRHYWSMQHGNADDQSAALPVLPGSAIYHLASLLGLEGPSTLLVVKSRVVYHAILISEFAAAAAVCNTMVNENGASWEEPAVAECIVDAVARVVSLSGYDDTQTKLALCNAVFQRDRGTLSVLDFQAYETVLDSFVVLESVTSRRRRQQLDYPQLDSRADKRQVGDDSPTLNDFLVFRAVGMVAKTAKNVARHAHEPVNQSVTQVGPPDSLSDRVYQDILTQYSTDMRELFWILRGVSASSKVDDPLLLTLGRLLGFWCIADALRIRPQSVPLEPERADLNDVLGLGISLLLHTQDREALVSCIGELEGILSRETVATMERAASAAQPDSVAPDPEIVQTLISRGYSENGARRAAVMTGNESAQVALVWAVSHTLDEGFDDPMVSVASDNDSSASGRVDQNMVLCLNETLKLANSYVSRKQTLDSLLPAARSLMSLLDKRSTGSSGEVAQQNGHAQKKKTGGESLKRVVRTFVPSEPVSRQVGNGSPVHGSSEQSKAKPSGVAIEKPMTAAKSPSPRKPSRIPQPSGKRSIDSAVSKSKLSSPAVAKGGAEAASPVVEASRSTSRKVAPPESRVPPSAQKKMPPAAGKSMTSKPSGIVPPSKPKLATVLPSKSRAAPRSQSKPATTSKAPSASTTVDRLSTLRSQDKNASTGTNLASDERQRLIAEGRRMLREARASRSGADGKAASTTETKATKATTSSRYPLRSRVSVSSPPTTAAVTTSRAARDSVEDTAPSTVPTPAAPAENAKKEEAEDESDGWDFDDF